MSLEPSNPAPLLESFEGASTSALIGGFSSDGLLSPGSGSLASIGSTVSMHSAVAPLDLAEIVALPGPCTVT